MPYANVPPDKTDEMERCVQSVMDSGKDKEAAIAICYSSIVGKSRKEGEVMTPPMLLPTTLQEIRAMREAEEMAEDVQELAGDFSTVVSGIVASPDISDKGGAVKREASVFAQMWADLTSGIKSIAHKMGARHSKADQDAIQGVHDSAVTLGAVCAKARQSGTAFAIVKAADGWRWVGVVSNNFKDRDGEIITADAHKEFMAHLDANPDQAPEWWTWHEDVGRKVRADFWDYVTGEDGKSGFVVVSGKATAEQAAPYARTDATLGMSHGFKGMKSGSLITQYRTTEVSDLPLSAAANPWTEFSVLKQEDAMGFTPEKRKYFSDLFGPEMATQLEAEASAQAKALAAQGIEHKEATPETTAAQPETTEQQSGADLAALTEAVKALGSVVQQQAAELAALRKSQDERVAEALAPRVSPASAGVRASADPATLVDASKAAEMVGAGNDWLVQALTRQ